jgi:hypothetical protein
MFNMFIGLPNLFASPANGLMNYTLSVRKLIPVPLVTA